MLLEAISATAGSLVVGNTSFAMFWMTTVHVVILMCAHWIYMWITPALPKIDPHSRKVTSSAR